MKLSTLANALLLSLLASLCSALTLSDVKRVTTLPTLPNKFIIEVADASKIPTKREVSNATAHEKLYTYLEERGIGYVVNKEFDSEIFVGASVTLSSAEDAEAIRANTGIMNIHPVIMYPGPAPINLRTSADGAGTVAQTAHILTNQISKSRDMGRSDAPLETVSRFGCPEVWRLHSQCSKDRPMIYMY